MTRAFVVAILSFTVAAACTRPPAANPLSGSVVDLSHEYSEQAIFWPTAEGFRLDKVAEGMTPQGYYYAANNFASAEHGGTHLDAPVHFAAGKWSVEQIPVQQLIGDAAVVDVAAASATQPDYQVTVADRLPARGATLIALPMKIKGGSGAPLRAVALVP
jgi:kynurenine formamidase